jgi:DNA-binding MarR family transcriptional regulator
MEANIWGLIKKQSRECANLTVLYGHSGVINQHILQSGFSLTEARILYELSTQGSVTANQLAARLKIDKSYMSRILAKFARDELITKKMSEEDKRALLLELTTKGNDMTRN